MTHLIRSLCAACLLLSACIVPASAQKVMRTVDTVAELLSLPPETLRSDYIAPGAEGLKATVYVRGHRRPLDGGGGPYCLTNSVVGTNLNGGRFLSQLPGWSWQLAGDVVTPAHFGAVGDGITDDTAAVRAAAQYGPTRLSSPQSHVYAVNQLTVTNVANQTWDGIRLRRLPGTTTFMVAFTNLYNHVFKACRFDAAEPSTVGSTVDAVTLWSSTNVVMSSCQFRGSTNQINSDLLTVNGTYTTVTANPVTDGAAYLIPTLVAPSENIVIEGCTFEDAGQEGGMVRYGARYVAFVGCAFNRIPTGTGVTYKGNHGTVANCVFSGTIFGIEVNSEDNIFGQGTDIQFEGNVVYGSRLGFNASVGAVLYNAAVNPTRSNGYTAMDFCPQRITLNDCTFRDMTHSGIHVRFVSDITLNNVQVVGVTTNLVVGGMATGKGQGLLFEGVNNGRIQNSRFLGATNENLYLINCTNVVAINNKVQGKVLYLPPKTYTGWVRWHSMNGGGFINNEVLDSYVLLFRGENTAVDGNVFNVTVDLTDPAMTNYIVNRAIELDRNVRRSSVSRNRVNGAAEAPIRVSTSDTADYPYDLVLDGNILQNGSLKANSGWQGIEIFYASNVITRDNFVFTMGPANKMSHAVKIYESSSNVRSINDRYWNTTRGSVWDRSEYTGLLDYPHYSRHVRPRLNPSGIIAVGIGTNSVNVVFPTAELASEAYSEFYKPFAQPRWGTTCWINNVSATGFTINFGTTPPADNFVYWRIE